MAKTAVNKNITDVSTYTIPSGKVFEGKVFKHLYGILKVNGAAIATIYTDQLSAGPIVANAGDVFSVDPQNGSASLGLSGFLYDVS
jgi:hypothetical protein